MTMGKTMNARDANEAATEAINRLRDALRSGDSMSAVERAQCDSILNGVGKLERIASGETERMKLAGTIPDLKVGFYAEPCSE